MSTAWHRPSAALRPWVSECVGYEMAAGPPGVHQGVASGHLTLVLCLDGRLELLANADPTKPPGRFTAMVSGLHDGPAVIATGEAQTGMQLSLTWQGARALLGVPAAAVAGDSVALDAVLGGRVEGLLDRLAGAGGWPERFALLDRELLALAEPRAGSLPVPEVVRASELIVATGGTVRVAELAAEVGWSRRHLTERFRVETGVGPKTMARVVRFEGVCHRLRRALRDGRGRPSLAEAAVDAGYADQAHLARDFRELAGHTATSWLAERA